MRLTAQTRDIVVLSSIGAGITVIAIQVSGDMTTSALLLGLLLAALVIWFALSNFEMFTLFMIITRTSFELIPFSLSTDLLRISVLATGVYTLAGVVWLARSARTSRIRPSPLVWAIIGVAISGLISAALSPDPTRAGMGASRWVFLALFALVMERLLERDLRLSSDASPLRWSPRAPQSEDRAGSDGYRFVRRTLIAFALSMSVPLVMGAWQIATDAPSVLTGAVRVSGSLSHPNTFGFYLVIMILGLVAIAPNLPRLIGWGVSLLAILATVLLAATYSRTSYLALAAGLVVIIVVGRRWLLLGVAIVAIAAATVIPGISERWSDLDEQVTVRGTAGNALAWRVDYWESVLEASADRRVTGLGLGVVGETTLEEREPHNDFLRAFAELGILGLIAYLTLLAVLVGRAVLGGLAIRRGYLRQSFLHGATLGFAAMMAAFLVGSLTGNLMTQLVLLWYFVGFAVLAGAGIKVRRTSEPRVSFV